MNNDIDIRVIRTKKLIKEAFLDLMETEGFEKINIQMLTNKAMIGRTTFYLHYFDKYDLLNQIENDVLDDFQSIAKNISGLATVKDGLNSPIPRAILLEIYNYVKDNQKLFKLLLQDKGDLSFFFKLNETMKDVMFKKVAHSELAIPQHYVTSFAMGIHTSIMNEWLKTGLKESPEEIVTMITHVMNDVPKNLFKKIE